MLQPAHSSQGAQFCMSERVWQKPSLPPSDISVSSHKIALLLLCIQTYHSKVLSDASTMTKTKRKVDKRAWPAVMQQEST